MERGSGESESGAQRLGEQVVVAVPGPVVVERYHEQVVALEGLEHRLPVGAARDRVAQRTGQLAEHRGVQQEPAEPVGQPTEHLLDQVVEDEAMAPGERLDEPRDVVAPTHRQRRQLEPRDPALGALVEGGDVLGGEAEAHHLVEEGVGLGRAEPQVRGPQLDQLAPGPQPRQGQRGVRTRCHGHGHLRREQAQQVLHRAMHGSGLEDVVVVERQHRPSRPPLEPDGQVRQHRVDRSLAVPLGQAGVRGAGRIRLLHGGREVGQEPAEVVVTLVEREPGHLVDRRPVVPGRQPLRQHRRLPEPGRRGDEHQPGAGIGHREPVRQPRTRHQPVARRRDAQLRPQDDHHPSIGTSAEAGPQIDESPPGSG